MVITWWYDLLFGRKLNEKAKHYLGNLDWHAILGWHGNLDWHDIVGRHGN